MIYDAIIIGGGHNGLVAACYLAKRTEDARFRASRSGGAAPSLKNCTPGFVAQRWTMRQVRFPRKSPRISISHAGLEMILPEARAGALA